MKFTVNVGEFVNLFKPVFDCASIKALKEHPLQDIVTFKALPKGLTGISNNGMSIIEVYQENKREFNWNCSEEGLFTVKASELLTSVSSFPETKKIIFTSDENSVTMTLSDDSEEFQTVSSLKDDVVVNSILDSDNNKKVVEIDRKHLLNTIDKIIYCIGFRYFNPEWLHWVLRYKKDGFRGICGDGSRFAAYTISGPEVIKTNKEGKLFVHKNQNAILKKLLEWSDDSFVSIYENKSSKKDNYVLIETKTAKLMLFGHNLDTEWPDENRFLDRENHAKINININDFNWALKGLFAAKTDDMTEYRAIMDFDLDKKVLLLKSNSNKTQRKVPIVDCKTTGTKRIINHVCIASYLNDVIKNANSSNIQFEFVEPKDPSKKPTFVARYSDASVVVEPKPVFKNETAQTEEIYEVIVSFTNHE